jgi:hypothetical protein
VDFKTDERFDNPRAVQVRLKGFDLTSLTELGCRIRNIYCEHSENAQRIGKLANDNYIRQLATAVTGRLGGKIGIAPRIFLKKLVGEVLDRIDQFPDFSPTRDYELTLTETEMTATERAASTANCVDDIEIKV